MNVLIVFFSFFLFDYFVDIFFLFPFHDFFFALSDLIRFSIVPESLIVVFSFKIIHGLIVIVVRSELRDKALALSLEILWVEFNQTHNELKDYFVFVTMTYLLGMARKSSMTSEDCLFT